MEMVMTEVGVKLTSSAVLKLMIRLGCLNLYKCIFIF